MNKSLAFALVLALGATSTFVAGCSGGEGGGGQTIVTEEDPQAFTVSLRNKVRLPANGRTLTSDDFAAQVRMRDPVSPIRCLADETPAFREAAAFLGGMQWSHPVTLIRDSDKPTLYDNKYTPPQASGKATAGTASSDSGAAPTIERPDLVGIQNGIAIFLSKQHGLLAVDARNGTPSLSCSMKLPGEPKNFLFRDNEIVIVVNALNGGNRSALLRYSFDGTKFRFVDSVNLEGQTIQDARRFDGAIVLYTSWNKEKPIAAPLPLKDAEKEAYEAEASRRGSSSGGGVSGGSAGAPASDMAQPSGGAGLDHLGTKVLVVQWDDALKVDWEDSLLDDPNPQNQDPGANPPQYTPGQVVSEWKAYKPFVAASDRYIVVPRDVTTTRFSRYETMTYQVCANWNPRAYETQSCSVQYEKRANPDYRAPSPTTGDYSCNGKKLADCVREAAPVVSRYIWVPVGQTCQPVWQGRCEKYESRSTTYPMFDQTQETEMTIYRFENGSFTKLDSALSKLVEKADAIAFETNPLKVTGTIQNRNQIQFQNGHLYVFGDQALQTMAVAGNSISYLNRLGISSSTTGNPAIVFSDDRAMISARGYTDSRVTMLDLTEPSQPRPLTSFSMPGQSTQLILAAGGILGPGQVSFGSQGVGRNLQKLTLFSKEGGQELDNLLLGTEYDAFESSWLDANDDQRIRLSTTGHLYLPYSGQHHAVQTDPTAHRLNISRIDSGRLVSERSFQVSDQIIRTTSIDDQRSLAFANSAAYLVDRTSGDWVMSTLRELFVPFATYRLSDDQDLHARIARVGSRCRITTHRGDATIFAEGQLAEAIIPCGEGENPIGKSQNLIFSQTRTGVRIGKDGTTIDPLPETEVNALIGQPEPEGYCYVPGGDPSQNGVIIQFLDTIPPRILCERPKYDAKK